MAMPLILHQVCKSFDRKLAIDQISFNVETGKIVGLLGPNGAGKTTLMRLILNEIQTDSGEIFVFDMPTNHHRNRSLISVIFQETVFPIRLTGIELLTLIASHFPESNALSQIIDDFQLKTFVRKKISLMSGGQARRLAIAQAFLGQPKIVIMDEPTNSLDIEAKSIVWQYLKKFRENGGSILLSTHDMHEAEILCDEIIMIQEGKICFSGSVTNFRSLLGGKKVSFHAESLPDLPHYPWEISGRNTYQVLTTSSDQLVVEMVKSQWHFENLSVQDLSLNDVFLMLLNKNSF